MVKSESQARGDEVDTRICLGWAGWGETFKRLLPHTPSSNVPFSCDSSYALIRSVMACRRAPDVAGWARIQLDGKSHPAP
jgi:hypothetical protein